ncbi:hypothetical protein [Halosolutus halophilus]|uniref:hypothetical protein n=1 Tax=Halosolutus halophilus TaxID=1552990 RepID=UPI0022350155|nr:hypothetical protein [Halosolutus halophilus]
MSPPPAFALLLLGCWVLMTFSVTYQAGSNQSRAVRHVDSDDGDGRIEGNAASSDVGSLSDD